MNLAKFALRNPITILMAVLSCLILGIISFSKLPVDMFPEITFPSITVATFYPGANPQDMERMVTYPVEKAVSTVNGVKYVSSISRQGASLVTIYFNWGTNLDGAQSDVLQAVNLIHGDLPKDVQYPIIRKFDIAQISVVFIAIMGGGLNEGQLYDLAYNVVEPEIEHVPNVAAARVVGGKIREIYVHFDRERLQDRLRVATGLHVQLGVVLPGPDDPDAVELPAVRRGLAFRGDLRKRLLQPVDALGGLDVG